MSRLTPKKVLDVRYARVSGKVVLVRRSRAFELNGIAEEIWNLINGSRSVEEIALSISEIYDVDEQKACNDCRELLNELNSNGLVNYV